MLILQNNAPAVLDLPGLAAAPVQPAIAAVRFDLDVELAEVFGERGEPGGIRGTLTAAADLFDAVTARSFAVRLVRVLAAVAGDPGLRVHQVQVLDPAERHQVLSEWNDTAADVPDVSGMQLISAQTERAPDAVAVVCGDAHLTYAGLDDAASRVAARTVALGEPAGWQREIYELVAAAQRVGIEAARPGADVGDVDAAARDLIRDAGHGDHFQHGLGHGVGLQPQEAPMLGYGRTGKLSSRVAVTVEPGVYLPGKGGVRIEDVLVVGAGAAGGAAFLTTTTRDLLVL